MAHAIVSGPNPPALVYLATPLEGTTQDEGVRISLAQILIEAGVQAVVAIQSPISPDRLRLFTDRFYRVLLQTGVVDRAIADARVAIYKVDCVGLGVSRPLHAARRERVVDRRLPQRRRRERDPFPAFA